MLDFLLDVGERLERDIYATSYLSKTSDFSTKPLNLTHRIS